MRVQDHVSELPSRRVVAVRHTTAGEMVGPINPCNTTHMRQRLVWHGSLVIPGSIVSCLFKMSVTICETCGIGMSAFTPVIMGNCVA